MKKIQIAFLLVFVLGVFSACERKEAEWKGTITNMDGVTVVRNPPEPMYDGDVLMLEEELTIGESGEEEEPAFYSISGIQADSRGNIYVLDGRARQVKVFDKEGKFTHTIGREGQGPGEFQITNDMLLTHDENIAVLDRRSNRLSFFSPEGRLLNEVSVSKVNGLFRIYPDSDGNYTARLTPRGQTYMNQIKKLDKNLEEFALIAELEHPRRADIIEVYYPQLRAAVMSDDKIVWGDWFEYKLNISDKTGKKIREINMDYRPVPISDEFKENFLKELSSISSLSRKVDFPENHPAFQALSCDEQGRIFVRTSEQTEDGREDYYDIFDEEGRYLAKIPLGFFPRTWKNNKLYAAVEDEEGYQVMKRFRVTWNY